MKSERTGKSTYPVKVDGLTSRGFWLCLGERRIFASFRDLPWFKGFTMRELSAVRRPSPSHLRWPAFDIDLEVESILEPARYPRTERRLLGSVRTVVRRLRSGARGRRARVS